MVVHFPLHSRRRGGSPKALGLGEKPERDPDNTGSLFPKTPSYLTKRIHSS